MTDFEFKLTITDAEIEEVRKLRAVKYTEDEEDSTFETEALESHVYLAELYACVRICAHNVTDYIHEHPTVFADPEMFNHTYRAMQHLNQILMRIDRLSTELEKEG